MQGAIRAGFVAMKAMRRGGWAEEEKKRKKKEQGIKKGPTPRRVKTVLT